MPRRRHLAAASALMAIALVLSACGSQTSDGDADESSGDGAFPVTIKHAFGKTTIKDTPERVVTIGTGSTGTAIALGNTPVGTDEYEWGADESGHLPWVREAVEEAGDELPEQFTGGTELDIEAVLKLDPDVILAPWSGITKKQYELLSDFAPTVAYPNKPWTTDWKTQMTMIGKALGKEKQAKAEIDKITKRLKKVGDENPEFSEHTFAYIYTDGPGTLGVYMPTEQRVEMLTMMGLKVAPEIKDLPRDDGADWKLIGLENADKLDDADLVFTWYANDKARKDVTSQPLYAQIPAIERDTVVTSNDHSFVTASSIINPLTVPWSVDRYVPKIKKAIAKSGD